MLAGVTFQMLFKNVQNTRKPLWFMFVEEETHVSSAVPLSKDLSSRKNTYLVSGLTLLIPFLTGVITHLLSGMSHQVVLCSNTLILGPELHLKSIRNESPAVYFSLVFSHHFTAIVGGKSRSPRVREGFEPRTAAPPRRGANDGGLRGFFHVFFPQASQTIPT